MKLIQFIAIVALRAFVLTIPYYIGVALINSGEALNRGVERLSKKLPNVGALQEDRVTYD
jgi:hypothetical protein